MEVNCSSKSERERKQKVFTSHLLQITLQQKAGRRRRSGSGMVQEQKAFLPRNAPRWELCVSQEFGFTSQTHPREGLGRAGPRLWGLLCSLMTLRLCPLAGQRFACRLKLQL